MSFLSDDLRIIHEDMPSDDEVRIDGNVVSGFITRDVLEPEEPDGYSKTIITFRSHIEYAVGTILELNNVEYEIAQVDGEEDAWQHRIVET